MIFLLQHFIFLAIDLLLATTLSCLFYAFICISIAFLTCFIIIFSFGIVERNIDVKGKAIVVLVSNSSIGRMFARNLDKAGFRVSAAHWPPREEGTATEEECFSSTEVAQLHMTEDEYQKTMKTFIESHLSLKGSAEEGHLGSQSTHHGASPTADTLQRGGMYGMMKKPSILIWEEEPDTCSEKCERKTLERKNSSKWKKVFKAPALCVAVLFCPLNCTLTFLKKRSLKLLVPLLKSKN
ncbi:PREDICTED: uncharacterized protein LOC106902699 isoform X1 [Calidris pugnax]|uniref:uncharacterized protein LOC106902699 isoform X1 n=1 Tax=Calidris pugnax TaxID=198806 RepID=UPI00071E31D9|nr:PREDICTED: uncharacterized protein LOC106902699 isoform X1 [Calidris pugnax]XP_014821896.1 PREDICTED: uncharacterized protein LOC106902699 isoform X1 [Calidris pugnax]XP_014821898.1 PREDICTED: uncharacterized protein LOC106902699 isoform X1 [Calidris pugnax]